MQVCIVYLHSEPFEMLNPTFDNIYVLLYESIQRKQPSDPNYQMGANNFIKINFFIKIGNTTLNVLMKIMF